MMPPPEMPVGPQQSPEIPQALIQLLMELIQKDPSILESLVGGMTPSAPAEPPPPVFGR